MRVERRQDAPKLKPAQVNRPRVSDLRRPAEGDETEIHLERVKHRLLHAKSGIQSDRQAHGQPHTHRFSGIGWKTHKIERGTEQGLRHTFGQEERFKRIPCWSNG